MRHQEPIYIQNDNGAVRNRDILNVNMSSDICIFKNPTYVLSGTTNLDCALISGATYIINDTQSTLPLEFDFIDSMETLTSNNTKFRFEVYKYSDAFQDFSTTPAYKSVYYNYTDFNDITKLPVNLPINKLDIDGEYVIKTSYIFEHCTDFLKRMGKTVNTGVYSNTNNHNNYFAVIEEAQTPIFTQNYSNLPDIGKLVQQVLLPDDGQTIFNIQTGFDDNFIITLNGLTLAPNLDYSYLGNNIVQLSGETFTTDIITVLYTTSGGFNLITDNSLIDGPIVSGSTDNQNNLDYYYNTVEEKYEVFTRTVPQIGGNTVVMLNGATLASGVDYYQSISNPKRFILQGNLRVGDLITIVYFPSNGLVKGVYTNNPMVSWRIKKSPKVNNGIFTLEVSNSETFNTIYYSGQTEYELGIMHYLDTFEIIGEIGDEFYYRVKNEKNYVNICGEIINTVKYSEVIPLVVLTNSINSY